MPMPDCKFMKGVNCTFEHETDHEDCTLCMTNVMLIHTNRMILSIGMLTGPFNISRNIHEAFGEIQLTQQGLVKLMEVSCPEAIKRARIPIEDRTSGMPIT